MSVYFNPRKGLIVITAQVWGPYGDVYLNLALDTGATTTLLDFVTLRELGYPVEHPDASIQLTSCTGIETVPMVELGRICALGQERKSLPVAAHTLPSTARIDGLLGLDFLRDSNVEIDFRAGKITLS